MQNVPMAVLGHCGKLPVVWLNSRWLFTGPSQKIYILVHRHGLGSSIYFKSVWVLSILSPTG